MSHERPVVLVIPAHLGPIGAMLSADTEVLRLWENPAPELLAKTRVIVTAGEFPLEDALTDQMPDLGLVAHIGVGYDGVDLAWAKRRAIAVTAARDVNAEDVADHALGLILASRRRILDADRAIRDGAWTPEWRMLTPSMKGQKLGVVGLGGIGAALGARAETLRMEVRWWGRSAKPAVSWEREESLPGLARWADVLAVCVKATEETRGLITEEIIHAVGPDGLLVNVSRGQVIDEDTLIAALKAGKLGAAALDVFEQEPTPVERWSDVPNTILTPHMAGGTHQSVQMMVAQLIGNIRAFIAGEPLLTPVQ